MRWRVLNRLLHMLHWLDMLNRLLDMLHWLDMLNRLLDMVHWLDMLNRLLDMVHWLDMLNRLGLRGPTLNDHLADVRVMLQCLLQGGLLLGQFDLGAARRHP